MKRKVVVPGEVIVEGDDYLPGDNTEKRNGKIYSLRYGLCEESRDLIRVIPLAGVYEPRRGNVVIGKVENIVGNGWVIDIGAADSAFLNIMEVPRYVNKDAMDEVLAIDDMVICKIWSIGKRGIDLSLKGRGFRRIDEGIVFKINPSKVPRVIGKEGSMIKIIKQGTGCDIHVGQNGYALINGDSIEDELLAKEAIMFVSKKSFVSGLTDLVIEWFKNKGRDITIEEKKDNE